MDLAVMRRRLLLLGIGLAPVCCCAQQAIGDPTRPPDSSVLQADGAGMPLLNDTRVRIVKIPVQSKAKASAVVDGQVIRLGEKIGEERLVGISEQGLILEGAEGKNPLPLIPDIEKKPVSVSKRRNKESL